jgi:hypothetical protein
MKTQKVGIFIYEENEAGRAHLIYTKITELHLFIAAKTSDICREIN